MPTLCNNGTFGTILNLQSAQKRARNTTVVGRMPLLWNKYYVTVFHKIMHPHHFAANQSHKSSINSKAKLPKFHLWCNSKCLGWAWCWLDAWYMMHDAGWRPEKCWCCRLLQHLDLSADSVAIAMHCMSTCSRWLITSFAFRNWVFIVSAANCSPSTTASKQPWRGNWF